MKAKCSLRSFATTAAIVAAVVSFGISRCPAGEPTPRKSSYSTNAVDQDPCLRQLNLIHGAIQEYQKRHQKLPSWLADLTPEFIADPQTLICPHVRQSGNVKKWKEGFIIAGVFGDPVSTYAYEFCDQPIKKNSAQTYRDYKQRQMHVMGFSVPIVRCFAHRPVLNLAYDGNLYQSPPTWEDIYGTSKEDTRFFHEQLGVGPSSQNQKVMQRIRARDPKVDSRMLDLSPHYNALLLHLSQIDRNGKLLSPFPEGIQRIGAVDFDVRGLVHLSGRNFPIEFPQRVDNIAVNRKARFIHFLHGAVFEGTPDKPIATLRISKGGSPATDLPIVYGRNVKERWFDARAKPDPGDPAPAWMSSISQTGMTGRSLRLYRTTWTNPEPDVVVTRIDYISRTTESAPFLIAVTTE